MNATYERIRTRLNFLYGADQGAASYDRLCRRLNHFKDQHPALSAQAVDPANRVTERDVILITYGDSLRSPQTAPLRTLHRFLNEYLAGVLSAVHILPFFPYSSDDGFSVIDYTAVDPQLGSWDDIERLEHDFKLMFDAVINHISARSDWFQAFLEGDPTYQDYFITVDPATDLSDVVRPRTLPLLSAFETARGPQHVWTTFSDDQIDLNYANPDVLLRVIDVLLTYVAHGASFIRLDAIAYLWKKIGTGCIHLPETHAVVQLFRDVLDVVAPNVVIITETNVPHAENVSYFGDGADEAQLVYQFTLPPLLLHTFITGEAAALSAWATGLEKVSDQTTFFNFTASHDGIGVRPVENILSAEQMAALADRAQAHGGNVSYKTNSDGTRSPYELNINYFDALSDPDGSEPLERQAQRFLASQAIQLAFIGVPGIYIHSLLGSRNWQQGVQQTGRLRSINREKLHLPDVTSALADPTTLRSRVFYPYRELIRRRIAEKAFHPNAPQQVVNLHPAAFTLLRTATGGDEQIAAVHNVSNQPITLDLGGLPLDIPGPLRDLISGQVLEPGATIKAAPYQVLWLKAGGE